MFTPCFPEIIRLWMEMKLQQKRHLACCFAIFAHTHSRFVFIQDSKVFLCGRSSTAHVYAALSMTAATMKSPSHVMEHVATKCWFWFANMKCTAKTHGPFWFSLVKNIIVPLKYDKTNLQGSFQQEKWVCFK